MCHQENHLAKSIATVEGTSKLSSSVKLPELFSSLSPSPKEIGKDVAPGT